MKTLNRDGRICGIGLQIARWLDFDNNEVIVVGSSIDRLTGAEASLVSGGP